jgi:hypothetical protein
MDQATQQNAALVEQSAAAAESLKSQAQQLVQAVAVFKLGQAAASGTGSTAVARVVAPAAAATKTFPAVERRGPDRTRNVARLPPKPSPKAEPPVLTARAQTRAAAPGGDDDWTTF